MSQTAQNRGTIIARILDWLRAGYPQGVPQQDYVALLGLLQRRLTPTEIDQIAQTLVETRGTDVDEQQIREAIRRSVLEQPTAEDVNRVQARLAAGGWPLASPDEISHEAQVSSDSAKGIPQQ